MKLSLGPVLFYWDKEQLSSFYAEMSALPLDVIYLGETVCSKRRAFSLDQWLGLGRELQECSQAQLVISSLTLIEAASELSSLRRLCDNGQLLVEANDLGAVQFLAERKLPEADQKALQAAAAESEVWLKPQYERWVDESMADAVKQGGTVTKISAEKRKALLDSVVGKVEKRLMKWQPKSGETEKL